MRESTATFSPSSPTAVMALARNPMFVNTGLADTDSSSGVDVQFWMSTFDTAGFDTPRIASPCDASVISAFDTGIEAFPISTTPWVTELLPNLNRQRDTEPVEPCW